MVASPVTPNAPATPLRRWWLWLVGVLFTGLLALLAVVWIWAGTPGSLAQSLVWAERALQSRDGAWGSLQTEGVEGSLRTGGRMATLRWTAPDLQIEAHAVQLDWSDDLWLSALRGAGLHPNALRLGSLRVNDQRAPAPSAPPESLVLPFPLSLPFQVDELVLSGRTALVLRGLQGHYRYDLREAAANDPPLPDTPGVMHVHRLRVDGLQWAEGQYRAQLSLGAEAPMPLALQIQAGLRAPVPDGAPVSLEAQAQVQGALSGNAAQLDVRVTARRAGDPLADEPQPLRLSARVMPWNEQPLISADLAVHQLPLNALWPQAPEAVISGSVRLTPEGQGWQARVALDNARPAPINQGGLPLSHLQAELRQSDGRWTVSALQARLASGELRGQGSFRTTPAGGSPLEAPWQGQLTLQGLHPSLLWSTLPPGALDGQLEAVTVESPSTPQAVSLRAQLQPATRQPANTAWIAGLRHGALTLAGQWQPDPRGSAHGELVLDTLETALAGIDLTARGRLNTAARSWDGQLLIGLPGARLAIQGKAGHAQGQGEATIDLDNAAKTRDALLRLQALPLIGESLKQAMGDAGTWRVDGSAHARLAWTGGWGALGWPRPLGAQPTSRAAWPRLQASVHADRLQFQQNEQTPTVLSDLNLQAEGSGNDLRWRAQGRARAALWQTTLSANGSATLAPDRGQLDVETLTLRLQPDTPATDLPRSRPAWELHSPDSLRLTWQQHPGDGWRLDAGQGSLQLQPAAGSTQPSPLQPLTLSWQRLRWHAQVLDTEGNLQGLSLPWIDALAALGRPDPASSLGALGLDGDLLLDGQWQVSLPAANDQPPRLSVALQRRSGDLRWAGGDAGPTPIERPSSANTRQPNRPLPAGIRDASLTMAIEDQTLQARLRWDTERLGQALAEFSSPLQRPGAGAAQNPVERWWPANSPIRGHAQVRLPEVGVWSMLAPPGWRMSGTLTAEARVGGTRSAPEWQGSLQGDAISLRSVVDGLAFEQGLLRATLAGDRIRVDRLSLQGPGGAQSGGQLEAQGLAQWRPVAGGSAREPFIELTASAERLRVSQRADRRLTLSGTASATLSGQDLQLRGQLKADTALFLLPDDMAPSLGDDVVVRTTGTQAAEPGDTRRVRPDVRLELDLGPSFEVRGLGAQTRLEGRLTVLASPASPTPRVMGEVRAAQGTYRAYGQQLNIETGVLRFTGPYDDPALDILAVRALPENTEQRVGVRIGGHAQAPRLSLFAEPDLPDADKLAWLVLGRPASASGAQAFVLQQAARRLLSRGGESIDGALARSLGLDEIGFTSADGTASDAALTVGKRLSHDLYLSYEQSVTGAMSTVSILYDISRRLTLRARAGTENAVDLIFTKRFD